MESGIYQKGAINFITFIHSFIIIPSINQAWTHSCACKHTVTHVLHKYSHTHGTYRKHSCWRSTDTKHMHVSLQTCVHRHPSIANPNNTCSLACDQTNTRTTIIHTRSNIINIHSHTHVLSARTLCFCFLAAAHASGLGTRVGEKPKEK